MANEITVTTTLKVSNGTSPYNSNYPAMGTPNRLYTQSTNAACGGTPSIGFAAHEALPVVDVSTCGWAYFKNTDATNFVQIGTDVAAAFVPFLKLKPGEEMVVRLATNAPYAKADTGAVKLQYVIHAD